MAAGDLITADLQVEYNGVVFGDNDKEVVSVDVWQGVQWRTSDIDRPLSDGQFPGEDYFSGRSVILEVELWGDDASALRARWTEMLTASHKQTSELPLIVRQSGWIEDLYILARPRRRSGLVINEEFNVGYKATGAIEFWATDPRVYGITQKNESGGVATASGGMTFNATFNLTFGATGASSTLQPNNQGTFETFPTFTITGPITDPQIEHQGLGKILSFTGTVPSGSTLVVDTQNRTVLLNGTTSRYNWLDDPTQWFAFAPGVNNIVFRGTTAGSPTIDIDYRNAWA